MAHEVIAGRYRLEERLGVGGMSEVWSAEDLELGRRVALKLLAADADPLRFEREARTAAALAHPGIVALYDYGETGGRPFMVLEYLPGGTLEDRLASGEPLPDTETARVAAEIAAGLAHAHARGLVHRDLKPSNILFDREGRARIADFGIARIHDLGTLTEAGTVLGTAAYISPEQAAGEAATPTSDVYSFGVILYRMLTGRLPFESPDAYVLVESHREQQPPPLAAIRPDTPPLLESVATAALSKSPSDRPRDGNALARELAAGGRPPPGVRAAPAPAPRPRRPGRLTVLLVVSTVAIAAAGAALAVVFTRGDGSPAPPSSSSTPASTVTATTRPAAG